jgi:hypothetical protein
MEGHDDGQDFTQTPSHPSVPLHGLGRQEMFVPPGLKGQTEGVKVTEKRYHIHTRILSRGWAWSRFPSYSRGFSLHNPYAELRFYLAAAETCQLAFWTGDRKLYNGVKDRLTFVR